MLGRMDEGLRLLEDGVSLTEALGVRAYLALWTTHLAEGLLADDQVERARAVAQRALDLARTHKERGHQAWALFLLGEIAARGNGAPSDTAREFNTQALALADELKMRPLAARVHLSLGRLYAKAGDRDRAQEYLGKALGMLREMDVRFWAARAADELMALGHVFVVARDHVQLYDYLRQEFAGEPVTVIVDRRRTDGQPPGAGAAHNGERRRHADIERALNTRGFVVIPDSQP